MIYTAIPFDLCQSLTLPLCVRLQCAAPRSLLHGLFGWCPYLSLGVEEEVFVQLAIGEGDDDTSSPVPCSE